MICQEPGVLPGSDFYFYTPSALAKERLFYFTSVGHFLCDAEYRIERQVDYKNYMLLFVKKGKMMITSEGKKSIAKEGDMVFLNCHRPHAYRAVGYAEFQWVHFDGSNTRQFYHDIMESTGGRQVFRLDNGETVQKKLKEIISNCRYGRFCSEFDDSLNIYQLIIGISKNMQGSLQNGNENVELMIEEALRFIADNLNSDLSVEMIADHVGLSESHFSRKFKKALNSSPKEYVIRKRLNEAKCLLKTTSLAVKEIAFLVGFNSESHFCNTFTAQNGLSPKKFREFPL